MAARNKIAKPVGVQPDELELQVAQNIADLEANVSELKAELRGLQFTAAKEVRIDEYYYYYLFRCIDYIYL